MALGDTGIPPIEHTGAYATFANGGKLAKPYGILEVYNSKGELVYSRERDEPPAPQVVSRRVVDQMNQLMQLVVTEGTGKRAQLDFTTVVGKTGTSSSYRDAWFMGFTGALVTGVWLGNDDYRPMGGGHGGITGGSFPAQIWQTYMSGAHGNMPIPPIPGLPPHPAQVAEQQRLAEQKRREASAPAAASGAAGGAARRPQGIMPQETRDTLKRIADAMRKASGGIEPVPGAASVPGAGDSTQAAPTSPDRRADSRAGGFEQSSAQVGARAVAN
jgi:penicillin-binding protein 1A